MSKASSEILVDNDEMADEEKGSSIRPLTGVRSRRGIRASNLILPGATESVVHFNQALAEKIDSQGDGEIGEDEIRSLLKKLLSEEKKASQYKLAAGVALLLLGLVFALTIASTLVAVRLSERTTLSSSPLFEGNNQLVNKESNQLVATEAVGGGQIVLGGLVTIPLLAPPGERQLQSEDFFEDEEERSVCLRDRYSGLKLQGFVRRKEIMDAFDITNRNRARWSMKVPSESIKVTKDVSLPAGTVYSVALDNSQLIYSERDNLVQLEDIFAEDKFLARRTEFALLCRKNKSRCCVYANRSAVEQEQDYNDARNSMAGNGRRILVGEDVYRFAW